MFKSKFEKYADEMLNEAFISKKFGPGEVKFSKSQLNDPHIKKIIDHVSKITGVSITDIEDGISEKIKEFGDIAVKSPLLYSTIVDNIIEGEVFRLLENKDVIITDAPQFSIRVFNHLIDLIKSEHSRFLPMRDLFSGKYLKNQNFIIMPSTKKEYQKYADIKTAAATPVGDFIFYKPFMQQLLNYAHLKGITPQGKKYTNNGGDIPAEWAYIEFLIMHEFLHYTESDFGYQEKLKADGTIINWVGDFRSNYLLVKSGYEQLPMGLFNDHINYDRQLSYKDMYELVKTEFAKLNKGQKDKVTEKIDEITDDHPKNPKEKFKVGQIVRGNDGTYGKIKSINTSIKDAVIEPLTAEEQKEIDEKYKETGSTK